jgi:hypothetical protein
MNPIRFLPRVPPAFACTLLLPIGALAQNAPSQTIVTNDASRIDTRHSLTIHVDDDPDNAAGYSIRLEQAKPQTDADTTTPAAWPVMRDNDSPAPQATPSDPADSAVAIATPDIVPIVRTVLSLPAPTIQVSATALVAPTNPHTVTADVVAFAPAPAAAVPIQKLSIERTALSSPPRPPVIVPIVPANLHTVTADVAPPEPAIAAAAPIQTQPISRQAPRQETQIRIDPSIAQVQPGPPHPVTVQSTAIPATSTPAAPANTVNLQAVQVDGQHLRDQLRIETLQTDLQTANSKVQTLTVERDQARVQLEIAQHDLQDARAATVNQSGLTAMVMHDDALAARTFAAAAAQGNASAQANLALLTLEGRGVAKDPARARTLLEQAAGQGSAVAARNLEKIYAKGLDTPVDPRLAQQWGERATTLEARAGSVGTVSVQAQ